MTSKRIKLLASLTACFCLARPALAWDAEGHMVVAQIAYNHLDPAVKAKCDALIAVPVFDSTITNNTFVTASAWADDIKGLTTNYNDSHFIDIPISLDGYPTNQVANDPSNVVAAINQCVAALQDSTQSLSNQATALRFLIHFCGDITQPLHCCTGVSTNNPTGDLGGNDFFLAGGTNLHFLWDLGGGFLPNNIARPLTSGGQTALSNKVTICETAYPYSLSIGSIPDPMPWALESRSIAQTNTYVGIVSNTVPSTAYTNTAQTITIQRMAIGGQRLAKLLNTIYVTNAPVVTTVALTNSTCAFAWTSSSGRTYRVQWKHDITESNWTDLADVTASTNLTSFTTNSVIPPHQFFRAIVVN